MNKIVYVTSALELFKRWPFFVEGLEQLNSPIAGRRKLSAEVFAKVLTMIATGSLETGALIVLESSSGQPLGFVALLDCTAPFSERSALVYAVYSNNKCRTTICEMDVAVRTWSETYGYVELKACVS